jgi:4-oxalocrotonate tautomerase
MPLVDIELIEGAFDARQKQEMIRRVTDAMVAIEGEAMRPVTWVRVKEIPSGQWGIAGKGITSGDVKAMQSKTPLPAE